MTPCHLLRTLTVAVLLLAIAAFLLLSWPLSAHANIIYNWTGTCLTTAPQTAPPCTGQATMLVITTDAYIPGEVFPPPGPFDTPVLLHALYADENVTYDFAPHFNQPGTGTAFELPASPSEGGFIQSEQHIFRSDANGVWLFGGEGLNPTCPDPTGLCGYETRGDNGVWTRLQTSVPAPSTLALLGVGIVGLAFVRRRERLT